MQPNITSNQNVYLSTVAPVKALCTERLSDWYGKFSKLGLPCIEVTGDTDSLDFNNLKFYKYGFFNLT